MTEFVYSAGIIIYRIERGNVVFLFLVKKNGDLDFPKGRIEKGESALDAAIRETKEETGLSPEVKPSFKRKESFFYIKMGKRYHKDLTLFLGEAKTRKAKISWEHAGYRWLGVKEAMNEIKYKDMKDAINYAYHYIKKLCMVERINREYSKLPNRIKGWKLSRNFVPGKGPVDAKVVLLGQAPGAEEDAVKIPFVGRSGKLLDSLLKKSKINREGVYITSVVQFFPPKNRIPTKKEIQLCRTFLIRQLEAIAPEYVIFLGNVSASAFFHGHKALEHHGKVIKEDGITYMFTLHPAAVLRLNKFEGIMLSDLKKFAGIIEGNSSYL